MTKEFYQFISGEIKRHEAPYTKHSDVLYLTKLPINFLELLDELRKLSHLCHVVQVTCIQDEVEVALYLRDSLELFTKLQPFLKEQPERLKVNSRFTDYLSEINS